MAVIQVAHDELEALHLCDGEGKTQQEAGFCMGISARYGDLTSARRKVAQALVGQKAQAISGTAQTSNDTNRSREKQAATTSD